MLCPITAFFFFFNDTATTEIYTLSLHDALPISKEKTRYPACPQALDGHGAVAGGCRSGGHRSLPGPRVGGDHADLSRSQPRNEGGDSGEDHAARWKAWSLPAWRRVARFPQEPETRLCRMTARADVLRPSIAGHCVDPSAYPPEKSGARHRAPYSGPGIAATRQRPTCSAPAWTSTPFAPGSGTSRWTQPTSTRKSIWKRKPKPSPSVRWAIHPNRNGAGGRIRG